MFKLPLLQPSLTGTNGIEGKGQSAFLAPFSTRAGSARQQNADDASTSGSGAMGGMEIKGWERQARDITTDISSSDKYKSLALHAEVKLAESLERCERVCASTFTPTGEAKPNKLKTAVCCQLLGEFAELCGPLSQVLRNIREELVKSIYSWYYVTDKGVLSFDQLPWFSVVERLEKEKEVLLAERAAVQQQMAAQQDAILRIEEQLGSYKRNMESALLEAASVRSHVQALTLNEAAARDEAKAAREELKKLRKEHIKLKDEAEAESAAHARLRTLHDQSADKHRAELNALGQAATAAEAEAQEARELALSRVSAEVHARLQALHDAATAQAAELSDQLKEVSAHKDKLSGRLDVMTPRPMWRKLQDHGLTAGRRTAEIVHRVEERLGQYASELSETHAQVALASALLQPEPLPAEVQLTLVADSSAYFLTEGGDPPASDSSLSAEPMGSSASVPRCLRWPSRVQLHPWTVEQAEGLVHDVWQAKRNLFLNHITGSMQSFLFYYFTPEGIPTAESVANCYSLYHAAAQHAKASPVVRLFWLVLTGQASEEAYTDQQRMVSGISVVLHELPGQPQASNSALANSTEDAALAERQASNAEAESSDVHIPATAALACLDALFPSRPPFRMNRLKEAFSAQFKGSTLSRDALVAALQPWGLQLPPIGAQAKSYQHKPGQLIKHAAAGPFIQALLSQHLEEVESLCLEMASRLASAHTTSVPDPSTGEEQEVCTLPDVLDALSGAVQRPRALACILQACGYSVREEGAGMLDQGAGQSANYVIGQGMTAVVQGGSAPLGDIVLPSGLVLDPNDLTRHILFKCLIKPHRNYDITGAVAFAKESFGSAAHMSLSFDHNPMDDGE